MKRCYLFAGPSAHNLDLAKYSWLVNLGPAKQSDVLDLLKYSKVTDIILADGLYKSIPAPWHKELILALHRGINIIGTSSIGALRASEMSQYGLVGYGKVYEYLKSSLTDDSEVAVVHSGSEDSWRPLTIAHVEVYFFAKHLVSRNLINSSLAKELVEISKHTYFEQRTLHYLLNKLSRINSDFNYDEIKSQWFSQKQLDLLNLVDTINVTKRLPINSNLQLFNQQSLSFTPYIVRQESKDCRPYFDKSINLEISHTNNLFLTFSLLTSTDVLQDLYLECYSLCILIATLRKLRTIAHSTSNHIEQIDSFLKTLSETRSSKNFLYHTDQPIEIDHSSLIEFIHSVLDSYQIADPLQLNSSLLLATLNSNRSHNHINATITSSNKSYQLFLTCCNLYYLSLQSAESSLPFRPVGRRHILGLEAKIFESILAGQEIDLHSLSFAYYLIDTIETYTLYHHYFRKLLLNRLMSGKYARKIKKSWTEFILSTPIEYPHSFYVEKSDREGLLRSQKSVAACFSNWPIAIDSYLHSLSLLYLDNWQIIYCDYVLTRRNINEY